MHDNHSVIVSVLVLVSSIGIAIAASLSIESSLLSEVTSVANNGTRNGNTEEQCQCVVFHLCDQNNVVNVTAADNQDRCGDGKVCCRTNPPASSLATDSPPKTSDHSQSSCSCVPFWECAKFFDYNRLTEASFEEEPIDTRRHICEPPDLCCPTSNVRVRRNVDEQECGIKGDSLSYESDIEPLTLDVKSTEEEREEINFGEFPWLVALFRTKESSTNVELICGGSLLSPYLVLTAAHCVNNIDTTLLRVRAGEHIIGSENETLPHQDRTVNAVHIHPNYHPKRLYNDMALLRVNEPFCYDSHINGICAPLVGSAYAAPNSYNRFNCWVAGWGKANITDDTRLELRKSEPPIVNHGDCQSRLRTTKLGTKFVLDSSFICAGGELGYDACKGDGGGALFCAMRSDANKFIQVGIYSWKVSCGTRIPSVFASLEANSKWLTTEINTMSALKL